jgi:hypothetical protein
VSTAAFPATKEATLTPLPYKPFAEVLPTFALKFAASTDLRIVSVSIEELPAEREGLDPPKLAIFYKAIIFPKFLEEPDYAIGLNYN